MSKSTKFNFACDLFSIYSENSFAMKSKVLILFHACIKAVANNVILTSQSFKTYVFLSFLSFSRSLVTMRECKCFVLVMYCTCVEKKEGSKKDVNIFSNRIRGGS